MIASLPMYDWPEERATTDTLYAGLRARDLDDLLPPSLTRPEDALAHWQDPALIFSQTCWGPISLGLVPALLPIAQPDYSDVPGGDGPLYRSALVARAGRPMPVPTGHAAALPDDLSLARFACNNDHSLSGLLGLARDLALPHATLAEGALMTGSHRASIEAVAQGRADLAAIDCRSWALAGRHVPCAADLVVIGWTGARPGLPYVTRRDAPRDQIDRLQRALISTGCHKPMTEGWK